MTLLQTAQAAENKEFQDRIRAAMFGLVRKVIAETPVGGVKTPEGYMAMQISGSIDMLHRQFTWFAASNPVIQGSVVDSGGTVEVTATDEQIMEVATSVWTLVVAMNNR